MKPNRSENAGADLSVKNGVARGTVVLDRVRKQFRKHTLQRKAYTTVKSSLLSRFFQSRYPRDNYLVALDELSLTVSPGESLGLIGRNGSGKSTLLKLISGIYRPDTGTVKVNGRVSALIELGAGFHPEFTGRENIYLGGVMYGLTRKEIDEKFDEIVRYAELEEFIDDPVRTYSSGMYMRLGFSLAVHTDPDILLIDEVLAVGDAGFIHRCHETISDFRRRGKTMIFVTHDLDAVARWCDDAIWLDKGKVIARGEPRRVIDSYLLGIEKKEEAELVEQNKHDGLETEEPLMADMDAPASIENPGGIEPGRWGNGAAQIERVSMRGGANGEEKWIFHSDEAVTVEVDVHVIEPITELVCGIGVLRADGVSVFGTNTDIEKVSFEIPQKGIFTFRFCIERLGLLEHSYFLDIAVHKSDGTPYDYHHALYRFSIRDHHRHHGVFMPAHRWEFGSSRGDR